MGNGYARLTHCFTSSSSGEAFHRRRRRRHFSSAVTSEPPDEGLGHSFCYVPPPPASAAASQLTKVSSLEDLTAFRSISGAAVSANSSAPLSTALLSDLPGAPAASFESSTSFASVPLQPLPRFSSTGAFSGPLQAADRGFMSGPLERSVGFMSGPLDQRAALFSGPLEKPFPPASLSLSAQLRRSLSHGLPRPPRRVLSASSAATSMLRGLTKAIGRTISGTGSVVGPVKPLKDSDLVDVSCTAGGCNWPTSGSSGDGCRDTSDTSAVHWWDTPESQTGGSNLQWAQGKAGEDRVHVVVSEEHGWVFVGIYDGFNGPDATDFLLSNLYCAVHQELKGLLWEDKGASFIDHSDNLPTVSSGGEEYDPTSATTSDCFKEDGQIPIRRRRTRGGAKKCEQNQRRWRTEWEKERSELGRTLNDLSGRTNSEGASVINHSQVLKALARALRKTEETFLDIADKMVTENPELALMGSCVLAMLMKGDDLYLMNVGDSRAILAQRSELDVWGSSGKLRQDLERINEESASDLGAYDGAMDGSANLTAIQLTMDHSTSVQEEVHRIRNEHHDDASAIVKDRVKGSLKVTRAFGAGFLKQPKWNDALLEMFRIDYVGTSPYITCSPFLYHHKLGPKDKFLILSSDGLYQYFTNEEVIAHVENFIASTPEGDPAQHLVEELLFRAAKKAGMDFHELLEIPHGDRRRYHDDVSIIVISLEGQIWRSCV